MDVYMEQAYKELGTADQRTLDGLAAAYGLPWLTGFVWDQNDVNDGWRLTRLNQSQRATLLVYRQSVLRVRDVSNQQALERREAVRESERVAQQKAQDEANAPLQRFKREQFRLWQAGNPGGTLERFERETWPQVLSDAKAIEREAYIARRVQEELVQK